MQLLLRLQLYLSVLYFTGISLVELPYCPYIDIPITCSEMRGFLGYFDFLVHTV